MRQKPNAIPVRRSPGQTSPRRLSRWSLPYWNAAAWFGSRCVYPIPMPAAKARQSVPPAVSRAVLTEAGYRCAVPTCRTTLAIDLHHLVGVAAGGGNDAANLLALCPNCHALFHRGTIHREALQVWKGLLVALNEGVGRDAKDLLLLLSLEPSQGKPL